jgi:hypothetical protein
LHRLDLAGYTAEFARCHFEEWLARERDTYREYEKEGGDWASSTAAALEILTYEEWKSRVKEVLLTRYDLDRPRDEYKDEIDRQMRDISGDSWLFYSGYDDILPVIRSMLEALPDVREVTLDIGPLIGGGWINGDDKICENRRVPNRQWRSILQPAVIITEGSVDIIVLKRSLQRLYPYLTDYITFFDYTVPSVDGGASYLVKFLRAFAAARINTNILAIFDNDAVGVEAHEAASSAPLPDNIRVTRLPDIEIARWYPTIGPQGAHPIDINGKAVSIEFFLGRHNISRSNGSLIPVVWSNYVKAVGVYQGAIEDKQGTLARFLKDTEREGSFTDYRIRFPELVTLWDHIFSLLKWEGVKTTQSRQHI